MVKEISNSIKGLHVASTLVLKGAQQITMYTHNRAVRSGAAGAARAAPLFMAKFVIIARVHSLLSPH